MRIRRLGLSSKTRTGTYLSRYIHAAEINLFLRRISSSVYIANRFMKPLSQFPLLSLPFIFQKNTKKTDRQTNQTPPNQTYNIS